MKILVILPTFNEKQNIVTLVENLLSHTLKPDVLVVDDASPDGTADVVRSIKNPKVNLVVRSGGKGGRGGAVREGLNWASTRGYDVFIEMDSDLSHNSAELGQLEGKMKPYLKALEPVVVIASRYLKGSSITGWSLNRRVFSKLSNGWIRFLLKLKVSDFTNGFRAYNKSAVEVILKYPQQNTGFIYLSEILYLISKNNGKILEFPSHWANRTRGQSTVGKSEIFQAFRGAMKLSQEAKRI